MNTGKVIKGPTIRSLKLLINDFNDMNFIGDTIIGELISELQEEFIDKYNIRQISENFKLQEELKNKLHLLLEKAKITSGINAITEQYKRTIHWEEY